jgi:hypothetical protein
MVTKWEPTNFQGKLRMVWMVREMEVRTKVNKYKGMWITVTSAWGLFKEDIQNFKENPSSPPLNIAMLRDHFSLLLSKTLSSSNGR